MGSCANSKTCLVRALHGYGKARLLVKYTGVAYPILQQEIGTDYKGQQGEKLNIFSFKLVHYYL